MNNPPNIKLEFKKEAINSYNENFEQTMGNIYTSVILLHQVYARLGYQIKIQEQILAELKKANVGKN